jgi:hypothetical protein
MALVKKGRVSCGTGRPQDQPQQGSWWDYVGFSHRKLLEVYSWCILVFLVGEYDAFILGCLNLTISNWPG